MKSAGNKWPSVIFCKVIGMKSFLEIQNIKTFNSSVTCKSTVPTHCLILGGLLCVYVLPCKVLF